MFGFSFGEILVIAVVAVIFLGPDKLPKAFVDIAKFIRAVKKTLNDAKDTLEREVHISEIKAEALAYKKQFEEGSNALTSDISKAANLENALNDVSNLLNEPQDSPKMDSPKIAPKTLDEVEAEAKKMLPKTAPAGDSPKVSAQDSPRDSKQDSLKDSPPKAAKAPKKPANLKPKNPQQPI